MWTKKRSSRLIVMMMSCGAKKKFHEKKFHEKNMAPAGRKGLTPI